MGKRRSAIWFMMLLSLVGGLLAGSVFAQPRVAVFDFEDRTDRSFAWWHGKGVGSGMADMLVTALVKSGKFKVFERQQIQKILAEQDFGASGAVTAETAAKIGKLLGVQYAIFGSVTEFGYSKGGVGGRIKGIGVGVRKYEATVAVDVRIVDVNTGEIIFSDTVRKQKSKSGLRLSTPKFAFRNQNDFDNSLVGKATREAINEIVKLIEKHAKPGEFKAKIVKVDADGTVIINAGSNAGVKVGDRLVIYREGEELTDPDTGLSLGKEMKKIGVIQVTEDLFGGKASRARIISGSNFQRGDLVKRK